MLVSVFVVSGVVVKVVYTLSMGGDVGRSEVGRCPARFGPVLQRFATRIDPTVSPPPQRAMKETAEEEGYWLYTSHEELVQVQVVV